jgi:dTDP-L-rhamnose 4-epimerase
MNILISGGAGFIGSHLALKLAREHKVTVLDNLSPQVHGENGDSYSAQSLKGEVGLIKGDVRRPSDWEAALQGQDVLVHYAAETGTGQSMYQVEKYIDVNVRGTAILLDILVNRAHSVNKIIVASSRAVYGEGKYSCPQHGSVYPESRTEQDLGNGRFEVRCPVCQGDVSLVPTDENSLTHPSSVYGISKKTQEELMLSVGRSLGIPVVAFRYQNVYGPGQSLSNPYTGIISIFSTRMRMGKEIQIFEDGAESRDFVFVEDAVDATVHGIVNEKANYEVLNVGSGTSATVLEIAQRLKRLLNSDVKIPVTGQYRLGDIRHNVADISKLKETLGFVPRVTLEDGLARFVAWTDTQPQGSDRYQDSLDELRARGLYK